MSLSCWSLISYPTRQLSIGAGYCPWGGYTDRIVCNIHGEIQLTSRYRTMLRSGTFSKLGILPTVMTTCQYWESFLQEAPCNPTTFGMMPKIVGTLPKVPRLTLPGPNWPHTQPLYPKLAQKRHIFVGNWPWPLTFDLGSQKISLSQLRPIFMPNLEAIGQTVLPF